MLRKCFWFSFPLLLFPHSFLTGPAIGKDCTAVKWVQEGESHVVQCFLFFDRVIGEAVMVNSLKNFCLALEPMLRRVVSSYLIIHEMLVVHVRYFMISTYLREKKY